MDKNRFSNDKSKPKYPPKKQWSMGTYNISILYLILIW